MSYRGSGFRGDASATFVFCLAIVLMIATSFAAWGTHVVSSILHQQWGLLIAGAIAFPVGIVHGVGIWIGVW